MVVVVVVVLGRAPTLRVDDKRRGAAPRPVLPRQRLPPPLALPSLPLLLPLRCVQLASPQSNPTVFTLTVPAPPPPHAFHFTLLHMSLIASTYIADAAA